VPRFIELIYLDTTILIAWIKGENRPNNEMIGVEYCFERIKNSEIKAISSVITDTEILSGHFPPNKKDQVERTLSRMRNFEYINIDRRISRLASEIRDFYSAIRRNIETPDANHLATAIHYNVNALYTFDADDLLPLNGNVAGHNLLICKPPLPKQKRLIFPN
jgi:predicted nucleic acid-binding protein